MSRLLFSVNVEPVGILNESNDGSVDCVVWHELSKSIASESNLLFIILFIQELSHSGALRKREGEIITQGWFHFCYGKIAFGSKAPYLACQLDNVCTLV